MPGRRALAFPPGCRGTATLQTPSWPLVSAHAATVVGMSAQPDHPASPDDPSEILQLLPARWHEQFLAEYRAALSVAREVRHWGQLVGLLHLWHLRAVAYSDPEFPAAVREARDARPDDLVPVPGWPRHP